MVVRNEAPAEQVLVGVTADNLLTLQIPGEFVGMACAKLDRVAGLKLSDDIAKLARMLPLPRKPAER